MSKRYVAVRGLSYKDIKVLPGEDVPDEILNSSSFEWLLKDGDIREEVEKKSKKSWFATDEEEKED